MTQSSGNPGPGTVAPSHCGDPMTLRETTYSATPYGLIEGPTLVTDVVELVWACPCGFRLLHEESVDAETPLTPALREVAMAAASLESARWHLDQMTDELELAVMRAARSGESVEAIAEAAHLDSGQARALAAGATPLVDAG